MKLYVAKRTWKCTECNFCRDYVCPSSDCIGCGACYLACPSEAVEMEEREVSDYVSVKVDGERHYVPAGITVKKTLEILGYEFTRFPGKGKIFAPCEIGGCWSCAVIVDGSPKPSCVTPVREGMTIETHQNFTPRRLVHGFSGHPVGGVGTPWWLKGYRYIEAACFSCGCNFRCPQCQNWTTTYCGKEPPLTPRQAAERMTGLRRILGVNRMAISGGECTLNREWLIEYIRELKSLNADEKARIHVDTNASILSPHYVDELVEAGMTDIGIDIKAMKIDTFCRITRVERELAEVYMRTSWRGLKHLLEKYGDRVFIGVGIPYSKDLISIDEIQEIGEKIAELDNTIQICVLDYRPEFRSKIRRPSFSEMFEVWRALKDVGLETVICQTKRGYIKPDGRVG